MVTQSENQTFEQYVRAGEVALQDPDPAARMTAIVEMLDGINAACSKAGLRERGVSDYAREHWYTRAAAVITNYVALPDTYTTLPMLKAICRRKQSIAYIFSASGYRGMSHVVDLIKQTDEHGEQTIDTSRAAVLLAFIGLDDTSPQLLEIALAQPVHIRLVLMLGWLNQRAILTEQGEKNRGRLLNSGELLKDAEITEADIEPLVNAWMYSSYASDPNKHAIKSSINQLLINCMLSAEIRPKDVKRKLTGRPKILVIHERFTGVHAMFRCYAPLLRSLRSYFHTVALADTNMIDSAAEEIFDEVITLGQPRPSVKELVALIQQQDADVIYYPSLGMGHWTVMVAALRLAPIQIMTHGHPATSKLETIDYAYMCELEGDLSLINSERIITGPETAVFDPHTNMPTVLPPLLPPSDREVRIAVNSKVMKLSWRLLDICKRIAREATVPVTFSFFPGERHAYMDGLDAAIRAQLPSATVVPYVDYQRFLDEMCKCDMALAAFPFGNTNSTVDTCLLGLPTVVHFGPESPAQTDWLVLRTAGLPRWLVCDNDEDYFKTALRLVNDPNARTEAMAGLTRLQLYQALIKDQQRLSSEPFGQVIYQLYRHHEAISASSDRVFNYKAILAMTSQ